MLPAAFLILKYFLKGDFQSVGKIQTEFLFYFLFLFLFLDFIMWFFHGETIKCTYLKICIIS